MDKVNSWDKGIDYVFAYKTLTRLIERCEGKTRCYLAIALIQLRNGSRISEAVRAFKRWLTTSNHELYVEVSKKKHPEARLMVIPKELDDLRLECLELSTVDDFKLKKRVQTVLYKYAKFNTHSLRYAYITYLLRQGVNPALISKLIKHSKLDTLLHYVQEKASEEVLREFY